jgi:hypothetical protein
MKSAYQLQIAVLVSGFVSFGCTKMTSHSKQEELLIKRGRIEIDSFLWACDTFKVDHGTYPTNADLLYSKPGDEGYLLNPLILDPWERKYETRLRTNSVAVRSFGPDGVRGHEDDLVGERPRKGTGQ